VVKEQVVIKDDQGNRTLYCGKDFHAGEVVLESRGEVVKIKKEFINDFCSNCLAPKPQLTCDEGCEYLKYCDEKC
jgi:hypothetical protein